MNVRLVRRNERNLEKEKWLPHRALAGPLSTG